MRFDDWEAGVLGPYFDRYTEAALSLHRSDTIHEYEDRLATADAADRQLENVDRALNSQRNMLLGRARRRSNSFRCRD